VARGGIEPPTYRFSGGRSYQLSYLAASGPVPEPGEVYRTAPAPPRAPPVAAVAHGSPYPPPPPPPPDAGCAAAPVALTSDQVPPKSMIPLPFASPALMSPENS
jgi:hypothetical protein